VRERNQVTAWPDVGYDTESVCRHVTLECDREEASSAPHSTRIGTDGHDGTRDQPASAGLDAITHGAGARPPDL
jgi:hypothetical protein